MISPDKTTLFRWLLIPLILLITGVSLLVAGGLRYLQPEIPDVATLRDVRLQVPLHIFSRDGKLLAQIGEQRRIPLRYDDFPQQVINAFLAAEDDQFFEHHGIDYPGLVRALAVNLSSGSRREGGGTITMQLARNMFLSPERSYQRKALEIISAWQIEHAFSKQEILTLYLNKIFLGQRAYGVGAAAQVYFGKSVADLTLAESALLAGLPRAPSRENPITNPALAKSRRSYVLRRMSELNFITATERAEAEQAPLESTLHGYDVDLDAPYIAEMARLELEQRYGQRIYTDNFSVYTTIDSRLQQAASQALRRGLLDYDSRHGYRETARKLDLEAFTTDSQRAAAMNKYPTVGGLQAAMVLQTTTDQAMLYSRATGHVQLDISGLKWARPALADGAVGKAPDKVTDVLQPGEVVYLAQQTDGRWRLMQVPQAQAAFVAIDPVDGAIVALQGGFDFNASHFNRAVQAKRQPGSSFKPFLYSAALEQGYTPASLVNDAPLVLNGGDAETSWRPQNSNLGFMGPLRLREALVRSRNLVSIRLMNSMGTSLVTNHMKNFGFTEEELPQNLSLALGATQVTPLEMVRGYAIFANGGKSVDPYLVERVYGSEGELIYAAEPALACADCASGFNYDSSETTHATQRTISKEQEAGVMPSFKLAPQVIPAANAFLMTDMMKEVIQRGTATRARVLNRTDIAGKTGTTNDRRDAWFVGFNSDLVAAAWVGFDQERSLGHDEEGGRTALPIWIYFMQEALRDQPEHTLAQPEGVVSMRVSAETGKANFDSSERSYFEYFMAEHLPEGAGKATALTTSSTANNDGLF
ncbi:MAG: penicillin-binding protein 1A [Steroidobacteraceae bacterium]